MADFGGRYGKGDNTRPMNGTPTAGAGNPRAVSKLTIVLGNNGNTPSQDTEYHEDYRKEEIHPDFSSSTFPRRHGSGKSYFRRNENVDTGAYSYAFRRGECRPVHTNDVLTVGSYGSRVSGDSADNGDSHQSSFTRVGSTTEVRVAVSSADPTFRLRIVPPPSPTPTRYGHGNNNIATITHVDNTAEKPLPGLYQELNRCIDGPDFKPPSRSSARPNVVAYAEEERAASANRRQNNNDSGIREQGVYSGGVFVKPRSECFVLKTARHFDKNTGGVNVNRTAPSFKEDARGGFVSQQEKRDRSSVERNNYTLDGPKSKLPSYVSSRPHVQQIVQQLEGENSDTNRNRSRSFSVARQFGHSTDSSEPAVDNKVGRNNRSATEDPAPQPSSLTLPNAAAWGGRYRDSVDAMHSSRAPSCERQRTAGSDMSTPTCATTSDPEAASGDRNYTSSLYLPGSHLRDNTTQRGGLYVRDGNKSSASAPVTPSSESGFVPIDERYDKHSLETGSSQDFSQHYRSEFERQKKQGGVFASSFQSSNEPRDYFQGSWQHDPANASQSHRTRVLSPSRMAETNTAGKPLTSPLTSPLNKTSNSAVTSPTHKLKPLAVQKVSKRSLQTFDLSPISSRSTSRRSSVSSQSGNDSKDLQSLAKNLSEAVSRRRTEGLPSTQHNVQGSNNDLAGVHHGVITGNQGANMNTENKRSASMSPVFSPGDPEQIAPKTPTSPLDNTSQSTSGDTVTIRKDYSSLRVPRPTVLVPSGSSLRTARWAASQSEKPVEKKAISAPTSPDRTKNLHDLTAKLMRDSPAKSPDATLGQHARQDSGLCSPEEEDQGCVMDLEAEKETEIQSRSQSRKKVINLPEVPKILSKLNREEVCSTEVGSPTSIEKFNLKAHLKPLRPKPKSSLSEDEEVCVEKDEKEKETEQWPRRRKKNSSSGPGSEHSGGSEGNGRSRSDPTQERKRGGGDSTENGTVDADLFGSLQSSGPGLPPLTDIGEVNVSADSTLSLSSNATSISDGTADAMYINVCRDVTRSTDVIINASIDSEKNGKSMKKTKSLTWPNGDKTANELGQYTQGIQESTSAPVVSERQEQLDDVRNVARYNTSGQDLHKSDDFNTKPGRNGGNGGLGKRHSSLSDPTPDVQSVKHARAASEPAPMALVQHTTANAEKKPEKKERTRSVGEQQKPAPRRRQPILPGQHFLRPQLLNIQMSESTPDLSKSKSPDSPSMILGPKPGSCATLPRATSEKKGGELSPASRRKQKQLVSPFNISLHFFKINKLSF